MLLKLSQWSVALVALTISFSVLAKGTGQLPCGDLQGILSFMKDSGELIVFRGHTTVANKPTGIFITLNSSTGEWTQFILTGPNRACIIDSGTGGIATPRPRLNI